MNSYEILEHIRNKYAEYKEKLPDYLDEMYGNDGEEAFENGKIYGKMQAYIEIYNFLNENLEFD